MKMNIFKKMMDWRKLHKLIVVRFSKTIWPFFRIYLITTDHKIDTMEEVKSYINKEKI